MSRHQLSRRDAQQLLPGPPLPDSPIRVEVVRYDTPTGPTLRVELSPSSDVDGVVIVARDPDERIAVVRQFRAPVGDYVWELPRGLGTTGSAAVDAAQELEEETGARALRLEVLGRIHPDSGVQRQRVAVVRAWVDEASTRPVDVEEISSAAWWEPARLRDAITEGVLCDGISLAALHLDHCAPRHAAQDPGTSADRVR